MVVIVVCAFTAAQPNEIQLAIGGGAGTLQVVTSSRLLREEAERLLMSGGQPRGRGEVGDVGPFEGVVAGDVVVTVTWVDDEPPELDYRHATAATADQLLTASIALDEYVRFGVWHSRFRAEMATQAQARALEAAMEAQDEANERKRSAILRASRLPMGRA